MQTAAVSRAELDAGLADVMQAPKTNAVLHGLCRRPALGQRQMVETIQFTQAQGIPGERWATTPWLRLTDGRPHPGIQVSILPTRVLDLVWRDRSGTPHPGDPIVADLDTSVENLPIGTFIQAGSAVLRVSDVPNLGCVKWKVRYGEDALRWVESRPELRLRGVLCSVEQDGEMGMADRLQVLR